MSKPNDQEIVYRISKVSQNADRWRPSQIRGVLDILSREIQGLHKPEWVYSDYSDTTNGTCKYCGNMTDDNIDSVPDICHGCQVELEEYYGN